MKYLRPVLIVVMTISLFLSLLGCQNKSDQGGQKTIEVTSGSITLKVNGNGRFSYVNEAYLSFGTGGKIEQIYVKKGDSVSKGMVLARLDTRSLELSLAQAEASVAQAKYNLQKVQETPLPEEIESARAAIVSAEEYLAYLQENKKSLEDALVVAQDSYDQAKLFNQPLALHQAQANLSRAQAAISANNAEILRAQANLLSAQAQLARLLKPADPLAIEACKAQLSSAEKSVVEIKRQIEESVITAPTDGEIAEKVTVNEGDVVPAGKVIFHVVDTSAVDLVIDVDEMDIPGVTLEQVANITVDALPGLLLLGKVKYISPLPSESGGVILYKVTLEVERPDNVALKAGMSASADIIIARRDGVIILPSRAIFQDDRGNNFVLVQTGTGTETRSIRTGISDEFNTEIVEGLYLGEKVVIVQSSKTESFPSLLGGQ